MIQVRNEDYTGVGQAPPTATGWFLEQQSLRIAVLPIATGTIRTTGTGVAVFALSALLFEKANAYGAHSSNRSNRSVPELVDGIHRAIERG